MVIRRSVALAVLTVALALTATAAAARDTIDVEVRPHATLLDDGSVRVEVRIRCAPTGDERFESNVTVSQDDGFIWKQTGLPQPADCDRRWHTVSRVVTPFEGAFHRGRASVSAYVSRLDPDTGATRQGQDVRYVRVR